MKKSNLSVLLFTSCILLSTIVNSDDIYKWTDEKGVTHYSEKKPLNQETETLSTTNRQKKSAPRIPFSETDQTKTSAEETLTEEEPAIEVIPVVEEKVVKQEFKKDKKTCDAAKKNEIIMRSTPLVRQNGKLLTIDEKNKQLADIQEIKKIHCE